MLQLGEIMAYIYKITNTINDKAYIGKTENTIEHRWKEHCKNCNKPRYEKRPLYDAMNKYGIDKFQIELIEETDNPEEREKYWVEHFDTYRNGYNATKGGDGKAYIDSDHLLKLWEKGMNLREIRDVTGHDTHMISRHLEKNGVTREAKKHRVRRDQRKPIEQIDLETGDIINVYPSSMDAGRAIGKPSGHIRRTATQGSGFAYGYGWRYADEKTKEKFIEEQIKSEQTYFDI